MAKAPQSRKSNTVATTRSTGGAGFAFEDLVAADLLTRFILDMPITGIEAPGAEILSQAGALGWAIDDLICIGHDPDGVIHRLALSCKSNVQVTASGWPKDFIEAAWTLWRTENPFNREADHIGLVTRGRNPTFDAVWSDIKSWCEDPDPALAMGRINASQKHRKIFDSVRNPGEAQGALPDDVATIALIAKLHLYPLDFQLTPSSNLEQAIQRCRTALVSEKRTEAEKLWDALVQTAETARLGSGIIRLTTLFRDLSQKFQIEAHPSIAGAWKSLLNLSTDQRSTIETSLPNGHEVDRPSEATRLLQLLRQSRICIVAGESGVGKSALVAGVMDQQFINATQVWLGPDALHTALSTSGRSAIGLDQALGRILQLSPGDNKFLILDSLERLDGASLGKLTALLSQLDSNQSWRVIIITQLGFETQLRSHNVLANASILSVPLLANAQIRAALHSTPQLGWIANDQAILPLFANLKTLGWVIAAESSFSQDGSHVPTSAFEIADRLWTRWTSGSATTQLQRLLIQLAVRDAAFERSFPISELANGDLAAYDQASPELPLQVSTRNRIEFKHDLASDWARYQRLKEISHDIGQWAALAPQPLWIPALRLLGQYLLAQPDQAREGWDNAFKQLTASGNVEASDILLDALCLDAQLDRHLEDRIDLLFANDGSLLKRLLHRFLHVATIPSIPDHVAIESSLRIYLEADMRLPIPARWWPMGRFLDSQAQRVGSLGAPIVARVCKAWLRHMPTRLGDKPVPFRDVMARVALETARTEQIESTARWHHGSGADNKLIFSTALLGAPDLPEEIANFALEMAQRRPMSKSSSDRVDALRAADRTERAARANANPQRRRRPPEDVYISNREELPPWPLGPNARLIGAFRDAVLHEHGLVPLMNINPAVATEVLLACLIEDQPYRENQPSWRMDESLGLEFGHESYPTIFWKSPFFSYLNAQPEAALAALKKLLDFVMERWFSDAPKGAVIPSVTASASDSAVHTFPGDWRHFGWSQRNSIHNGQLHSALDALERWLVLKIDAQEDIAPWCSKLLDLESSTAILGVLVNVGKHKPDLFSGPLRCLVGVEDLYWWDHHRVSERNFSFDTFSWYRQGETVFEMARDWVLAPHRKIELRTVIGDLAAQDLDFAAYLRVQTSLWPLPDNEKDRLELRILLSEFDPANRQLVFDEASGVQQSQFIYPEDLQAEVVAYQAETNAQLQPLTLPHQCRKILSQARPLADADCDYLASLLPADLDDPQLEHTSTRTMIAAAAATLVARGGDWLVANAHSKTRAVELIKLIIDRATCSDNREDRYTGDEALAFAAMGAFCAALIAEEPGVWDMALTQILSSGDRGAINSLMATAHRHKEVLGPAWYQLNFILILAAALDRLAPRYGEVDRTAVWQRWGARLRSLPVFGTEASIETADPKDIARRTERLLERRHDRQHHGRPERLNGKARRFAGLSSHILESGYAWLLDHENSATLALDLENHRLLDDLWAFEAWRMEGDRGDLDDDLDDDRDEEYDLPSGLGYAILRIAPTFVMARPREDQKSLWRAILGLGPNGHHAVDQFAASWFLLLFKQPDPDQFMTIWKAMLDTAFASDWSSHRRWYRARRMMVNLLGMHSHAGLGQAQEILGRLPELIDYYRRWAQRDLARDEDELSTFCHFLTTEAGTQFRVEGICWIQKAMAESDQFYRARTGNSVAEVVDCILTDHAESLMRQQTVRDAVIAIVAKLVAAQISTAMGLQTRLAALK